MRKMGWWIGGWALCRMADYMLSILLDTLFVPYRKEVGSIVSVIDEKTVPKVKGICLLLVGDLTVFKPMASLFTLYSDSLNCFLFFYLSFLVSTMEILMLIS